MSVKMLDKISLYLNRVLIYIGSVFLVGMLVLTCANIILRWIWVPIGGTFELMGFFGAIVTASALGYTQIKGGHISVNVLINTFSEKSRKILKIVNAAVCMIFFSIASWQIAKLATRIWYTGEVTETLRIAYHPFIYGTAIGFAVLSLVFFADLIKTLFSKKENER
jgi:TRAP-type C4-dicarboxylate transport system permease small subunit